MSTRRPQGRSLETLLGIMLLVGVAVSLALELAGVAVYWQATRGLAISRAPAVYLRANGFVGLLADVFGPAKTPGPGRGLMSAGIVLLILTPLARVAASLAFFAWKRQPLYVALTLVVLAILSVSLILH